MKSNYSETALVLPEKLFKFRIIGKGLGNLLVQLEVATSVFQKSVLGAL